MGDLGRARRAAPEPGVRPVVSLVLGWPTTSRIKYRVLVLPEPGVRLVECFFFHPVLVRQQPLKMVSFGPCERLHDPTTEGAMTDGPHGRYQR